MVFFFLATVGWAFSAVLLNQSEAIFRFFNFNASPQNLILFKLSVGFSIIFILYSLPHLSSIKILPEVYASGDEEIPSNNTPSSKKLDVITVSNELIGTHEITLRNLTDAFLVGSMGKVAVSAMSQALTIQGKLILGASTIASLGAVVGGLRAMDRAKNNLKVPENSSDTLESSPPSSPCDNFTVNSPLEESSSDNLMTVINSVETLLGITLILFIMLILFIWFKSKIESIKPGDTYKTKHLSPDNVEWLLEKSKIFLSRSSMFYLYYVPILILFNLVFALYFTIEIKDFLSMFKF